MKVNVKILRGDYAKFWRAEELKEDALISGDIVDGIMPYSKLPRKIITDLSWQNYKDMRGI